MISNTQLEQQLLSNLMTSWKMFVNGLPVQFDAANSIPQLEDFGRSQFNHFQTFAKALIDQTEFRKTSDFENGMNSPGILWDRLTILNCKLLFTSPESVHHKPDLHRNLGNVLAELESVSIALSQSRPAKHILLAKEATARQNTLMPLEDSLWKLQESNIAMWINQDLLYTVNADDVEPQRLRDYIRFFSVANRIRNTSIENIEIFYSESMQRK